jgi:hypothetical protein
MVLMRPRQSRALDFVSSRGRNGGRGNPELWISCPRGVVTEDAVPSGSGHSSGQVHRYLEAGVSIFTTILEMLTVVPECSPVLIPLAGLPLEPPAAAVHSAPAGRLAWRGGLQGQPLVSSIQSSLAVGPTDIEHSPIRRQQNAFARCGAADPVLCSHEQHRRLTPLTTCSRLGGDPSIRQSCARRT